MRGNLQSDSPGTLRRTLAICSGSQGEKSRSSSLKCRHSCPQAPDSPTGSRRLRGRPQGQKRRGSLVESCGGRAPLSGRFRPEGSIKGSIPTARSPGSKSVRTKKRRHAALLQSPLTDSNRRPLLTMEVSWCVGESEEVRYPPCFPASRRFALSGSPLP